MHHEFAKTYGMPNQATFIIEPRMSKLELQEYLRKVYSLNVTRVFTVNLPKKGDSSKVFKKAVVMLGEPKVLSRESPTAPAPVPS